MEFNFNVELPENLTEDEYAALYAEANQRVLELQADIQSKVYSMTD